jgi:O-antigen/teichoic acid export membrane protein
MSSSPQASVGRTVAKNTIYLTAAQALTVPLAVLVNSTMARYLGAADFGLIYLATTLGSFAFLAVNWGHEGALPALVVQDQARAGALLGSSLAWRSSTFLVTYLLFAVVCHFLHYGLAFQWALALTFVINAVGAMNTAFKDGIRGFERTDIPALAHVGQQLLIAMIVLPVLMLGGGLRGALAAQIPACALVLLVLWRAAKSVGVGSLAIDRQAMKALFVAGTPFVFFNLALELQPNIDAVFLSKLAPAQVMGWFGVSRRLVGLLLFPAAGLIGALYPTLCRLHAEKSDDFGRVARGAFQGVAMLAVPVAVGCGFYPELGVAMFSRTGFSGAEDNLRIFSVFVFLVYFSMPLGTVVVAAGKQRAWSLVQGGCLVVSLALDPLLIPYFQARHGNGGLGLCVAAVVSESFVVGAGLLLTPRGVFDRKLMRGLLLALISGGIMGLVAWLLKSLTPWLAAPVTCVSYAVALWLTGGIPPEQLQRARGFIGRKFSRR